MKRYVGIWIDHKKAFIATVTVNKPVVAQEAPEQISIEHIP